MECRRHRLRGERGAVLVEFVMVLPLLFALVFGITSGGQAYSTKITLVGAVREGARFGATLRLSTAPTAVADFEASVTSRIVATAAGTLDASNVCVKLVLPTGATDCGIADPVGASAQPTVHLVKVSASKSATIQFFFLSTSKNLSEQLATRYERDSG